MVRFSVENHDWLKDVAEIYGIRRGKAGKSPDYMALLNGILDTLRGDRTLMGRVIYKTVKTRKKK